MVTKKCKKMQKIFSCEKCDFHTPNKFNYKKHLQTKKHNGDKWCINGDKKNVFLCECGKKYSYRQGLQRHKKTCFFNENTNLKILSKNVQNVQKCPNTPLTIHNHYYNQTIQTNHIQNNSFSVKNYLNNECKDAYTIQEVLDNFNCDIMKLPTKPIEFYKNVIDAAFKNMPVEKLPIRCSDTKRKTFYVNAPIWNKNFDIVKEFIMKLVDSICEIRTQYSNKNPQWFDNDIISEIMNSIIINISKVYDEKTVNQIMNYIAERTKIVK